MTLRELLQALLEGELDDEVVVRRQGKREGVPWHIDYAPVGVIAYEPKDGEAGRTVLFLAAE